MAKVSVKETIFAEIRQTIKFLMREKEKGREDFDIADFFDKKLESEIVKNFDNKITNQEYEDLISELFGKKAKKKKAIPKGAIQKETDKLIKQYRMRSKKKIFERIYTTFTPDRDDFAEVTAIIKERYRKQLKDPLTTKITSLTKSGTVELRLVMSVLRREGYDADSDFIEGILKDVLKKLDKTKQKYGKKGRRSASKAFAIEDPSPVKERLREQMRKSLVQKTRYNKQRFMRKECPQFRFEMKDNKLDGVQRAIVHSGELAKTDVVVKTLLTNERISDVQVTIKKTGVSRGGTINIIEFQKSVASGQGEAFLQRWLKGAIKHTKFNNVQELVWFMIGITNDRFGLPEGVSRYLAGKFVNQLNELDKFLTKFVIEKALESVG